MQCVHHPTTAAKGLCTRCDVFLCDTCFEERRGKRFCADCADFLDRREAARLEKQTSILEETTSPESVGGFFAATANR